MTIVSTMEGMKAKTMEQFAAMGANRIEVSVYAYMYDEGGNPISKDYFAGLYRFCSGLKESIIGITPKLIQRYGGIRYEKQLHNGVEI